MDIAPAVVGPSVGGATLRDENSHDTSLYYRFTDIPPLPGDYPWANSVLYLLHTQYMHRLNGESNISDFDGQGHEMLGDTDLFHHVDAHNNNTQYPSSGSTDTADATLQQQDIYFDRLFRLMLRENMCVPPRSYKNFFKAYLSCNDNSIDCKVFFEVITKRYFQPFFTVISADFIEDPFYVSRMTGGVTRLSTNYISIDDSKFNTRSVLRRLNGRRTLKRSMRQVIMNSFSMSRMEGDTEIVNRSFLQHGTDHFLVRIGDRYHTTSKSREWRITDIDRFDVSFPAFDGSGQFLDSHVNFSMELNGVICIDPSDSNNYFTCTRLEKAGSDNSAPLWLRCDRSSIKRIIVDQDDAGISGYIFSYDVRKPIYSKMPPPTQSPYSDTAMSPEAVFSYTASSNNNRSNPDATSRGRYTHAASPMLLFSPTMGRFGGTAAVNSTEKRTASSPTDTQCRSKYMRTSLNEQHVREGVDNVSRAESPGDQFKVYSVNRNDNECSCDDNDSNDATNDFEDVSFFFLCCDHRSSSRFYSRSSALFVRCTCNNTPHTPTQTPRTQPPPPPVLIREGRMVRPLKRGARRQCKW